MSIKKSLRRAVLQSEEQVCAQCGKTKRAINFYAGMAHCKLCHNAGIERERWASPDRQWGDPSEEQIAEACEAFKASWTPKMKQRRKAMNWLTRRVRA